ncbi:MAG: PhoH family protein [Clostridia bacterium]|nr:PhoH family protein [Clostridia bacterium]
MPERIVTTSSEAVTSVIFGTCDANVKAIEEKFGVRIANKGADRNGTGDVICVTGQNPEGVRLAVETLEYLKRMTADGDTLSEGSVAYVISSVESGEAEDLGSLSDVICVTMKGKPIRPKTVGQKKYVDAIRKNTVTIGVGPAGTGKTFLAVAMAVEALRNKKVSRIILTRPAVEAGEKLGFLPGDLQSKIDPYLRPLYDSLHDMFGAENYQRHLERNTIEIAPLAYMRGRTLDDSFIILDEAQNTTAEQMKMFLTRLGNNSRIVVTGDPSQTDLPFGKKSGLAVATRILRGIEGIAVHQFTERDVVRHPLVQKIITAYDKYERERKNESARTFSARRFSEEKKG